MIVATKVKSGESFFDFVKTLLGIVLIVIGIRTMIFEPFNIPSGSMKPTLLVGDYVWVSKYAYGYSRYSLPFIHPNIAGRIFGRLPERGDVAVFKLPNDPSLDYIKRIVGLPGDKIQVIDGLLYVNGTPVERTRIEDFVEDDGAYGGPIRQFSETLPNGVTHPILQKSDDNPLDNTIVFVVPEGHVFGMGDNRTNSTDSRVLGAVGYIPIENLVGRAEFRFFSFDTHVHWWALWDWPGAIRWDRLFTGVH